MLCFYFATVNSEYFHLLRRFVCLLVLVHCLLHMMTSSTHRKGSKSRKASDSANNSRHDGGPQPTVSRFGVWSTIVRLGLAILTVATLSVMIYALASCDSNSCGVFVWLMTVCCILILFYGLWGIFTESFCAVLTLAVNTLLWAILNITILYLGLVSLFTSILAFIYLWMLWQTGNLWGALCVCVC